ncbi:hypothetical protein [Fusobacterium varium]|uniref:hypothetical protein n=1 Tax=Fusobacterium varium TaxID=856 RepID=UPI00242FA7F9|nr:hypothetical protein [Fusobacterium varium]
MLSYKSRMKKIVKLIGNYFLKIVLFFLTIFTYGYANTKLSSPEVYFSGTQLQLAQVIARHNIAEVQVLALSTNLNKPNNQEMTLLMDALWEATKGDTKSLEIVTELMKAGADPLQDISKYGQFGWNGGMLQQSCLY